MTPSPARYLLLSGWASPARAMDPLAKRLEQRGEDKTTIIRLNWADVLKDPAAVWNALKDSGTPTVGVGWSMGGAMLLEAALEGRLDLSGLVLVSSMARGTADGDAYPGVAKRTLHAMQIRLERDPEATLRDFLSQAYAPEPRPDGIAHRILESVDHESLAEGLRYLARVDLRSRLAQFDAPCLIAHGELDQVVPPEAGRFLVDQIPNARHALFPKQGHALPLTAPDDLWNQMEKFLNDERF